MLPRCGARGRRGARGCHVAAIHPSIPDPPRGQEGAGYTPPKPAGEVNFLETFTDDALEGGRWVKSSQEKYEGQAVEVGNGKEENKLAGDQVRHARAGRALHREPRRVCDLIHGTCARSRVWCC